MASIYLRGGKYWYLQYTIAGKSGHRSLGAVSETTARQLLAAYEKSGRFPRRRKTPALPSDKDPGVSPITLGHLGRMYQHSRGQACERNIPYEITLDDLRALYERSGGCCEVTGIPFSVQRPKGVQRRPWFPSIDRIESALGYTKDNCRLVCVAVNIALADFGLDVLRKITKGVYGMARRARKFTPDLHHAG